MKAPRCPRAASECSLDEGATIVANTRHNFPESSSSRLPGRPTTGFGLAISDPTCTSTSNLESLSQAQLISVIHSLRESLQRSAVIGTSILNELAEAREEYQKLEEIHKADELYILECEAKISQCCRHFTQMTHDDADNSLRSDPRPSTVWRSPPRARLVRSEHMPHTTAVPSWAAERHRSNFTTHPQLHRSPLREVYDRHLGARKVGEVPLLERSSRTNFYHCDRNYYSDYLTLRPSGLRVPIGRKPESCTTSEHVVHDQRPMICSPRPHEKCDVYPEEHYINRSSRANGTPVRVIPMIHSGDQCCGMDGDASRSLHDCDTCRSNYRETEQLRQRCQTLEHALRRRQPPPPTQAHAYSSEQALQDQENIPWRHGDAHTVHDSVGEEPLDEASSTLHMHPTRRTRRAGQRAMTNSQLMQRRQHDQTFKKSIPQETLSNSMLSDVSQIPHVEMPRKLANRRQSQGPRVFREE